MAEDLMLMTLWPIFVYVTLQGIFGLGLATTVASIVATVIMLYVGKLLDRKSKSEMLQLSAVFYGLTWLFRFAGTKIWSIVALDSLGRTGKGMTAVSMSALTLELAGRKGADAAIAYSVFYEFSLSIGKIVTAFTAIAILIWGGELNHVFILTGILTMCYGLLRK